MRDDVIVQLRRYGEAVEDAALDRVPTSVGRPRRRPLLATAAAVLVLVAVAAVALGDDAGRPTQVDTAVPDTSTSAPPPLAAGTISGTATWTGGGDPRATLRVGACPVDSAPGCPDARSTAVAADGTFTLVLPVGADAAEWTIAAYVTAASSGCVFRCEWLGAQVGEPTTLSAARARSGPLHLEVAARVVDVRVRDRNGDPFAGGGVQLTSVTGDVPPMFVIAEGAEAIARVVVHPDRTYDIHAQARDTGWPDPQWTNDGSEFWFSPDETFTGAGIPEGHVLRVDGAPAPAGQ